MAWLARTLARGLTPSAPLVAVVHLRGVIGPPARAAAPGRRPLNADRARPWLDLAFGLRPDAVALRINSPGGSPAQTELLVADIRRRAAASSSTGDKNSPVPVYAFAEDVAASGGQWLLSAAPTAGSFALPTSIVGSIGVISPSFGAVRALDRLGLERRLYKAGSAKGGLDPFSKVDPDEEARLEGVLADLHSSFISAVRSARGPALSSAAHPVPDDELFSGRVWTGRQAASMGLVDGLGSLVEVMTAKFGPRTRFVECGERVPSGAGLFGSAAAWLRGGGGSDVFATRPETLLADAVAGVPAAVLAALEERAAYERVGAGGAVC
jgi:ClpP class serine protease